MKLKQSRSRYIGNQKIGFRSFFIIFNFLTLAAVPGMVSAATIDLFDNQLSSENAELTTNNVGNTQQFVKVNTSSFDAFRVKESELGSQDLPETLNIRLFNGVEVTANFERFEIGTGGSVVWIGSIDGQRTNAVSLSINDSVMYGVIEFEGIQYQIRYSNGSGNQTVHTLEQIDPRNATPDHEPGPLPLGQPSEGNNFTTEEDSPISAADDSGAIIDMLVVWGPNAEAAAGGSAAMTALIDMAVADVNTGHLNSGVSHSINLVHSQQVSYNSTSSTLDDLSRLQNPTDGYLDEVHVLRETFSADLVHFIGDYVGITCGRAYLNVSEAWAFGVTSWHCAVGNHTLAHEIGHNMGALHDRLSQNELGNAIDLNYGHYIASEQWRTIMSLNNTDCLAVGSCSRLNYWSNPNINNPNTSTPTGIQEGVVNAAENWKILNNRAFTVANFRTSGDAYESDNTPASASTILNGIPQVNHSIHDGGFDVDWVSFQLTATSDVTLETSGSSSSDTRMWLYDSSLTNQLAFNDDGGVALFSKIVMPALAAGTYFIKVDEFQNDDVINDYTMSFDETGPGLTCNGLLVTVDLNLGQTTTPDDDVVIGTPGNDDIRGKAGNDTICGMGGDDFIHGNSGNDWIDGGLGVDSIRGGQGDDVIFTGDGSTVGTAALVFGGNGDDVISGGDGDDDLRGGRGEDLIMGFGGNDEINGNNDNDVLSGLQGNDTIKGGLGDDILAGNAGDDTLQGGVGDDDLTGGGGSNDFCDGGPGINDVAVASCETVANIP